MRRHPMFLAALILAAGAGFAPAAEPLDVHVVNHPLAFFAERIGGDAVAVRFPVPTGRDPSFWRPSIAEIAAFQKADLILLNGAGYAAWTAKTSLPRARSVDTSRGFADRYIETEGVVHSHGADGEHAHAAIASHTWLDFTLAALQAEAVAEALARRLPERAGAIAAAHEALAADLAGLDAEARRIGAAADGVWFIASHPRYQYFASAYGLNMDSLEWESGAAPTDAQWAEFDALLGARAADGSVVMIWEAAPPAEARAALEARGVTGTVFDPGARRPASGWDAAWLELMRANLAALAAALGAP